jgi:hypothetical protein
MKDWQFFLAIALLLLLLLPMYESAYEGATLSYPFQLSPEQTKIMGRAPLKPEDEDEIIQLMTSTQLKQIPEIKRDNYEKLYKITTATRDVIHKLTAKEINNLSTSQFEALLRRLTKLNVGLRPEQLNGMSQPGLNMLSDKLKSATYNLNSF